MQSGMLGTLKAMWDVFPLFSNTGWGESSNIAFLKKHMGANFEKRPEPWVSELNPDDIHSGDFLVISKIKGRWGGFETLEKWVTGAYAGHTAVCLKDSVGKLWVGESGHENEEVRLFLVSGGGVNLCLLYGLFEDPNPNKHAEKHIVLYVDKID
jgi:hypothetical protein